MRAWVLTRPGSVATRPLRWSERADPAPGPDEVCVRVEACGVCRTDLHLVEGDLARARTAQPQRPESRRRRPTR